MEAFTYENGLKYIIGQETIWHCTSHAKEIDYVRSYHCYCSRNDLESQSRFPEIAGSFRCSLVIELLPDPVLACGRPGGHIYVNEPGPWLLGMTQHKLRCIILTSYTFKYFYISRSDRWNFLEHSLNWEYFAKSILSMCDLVTKSAT